MQGLFAPGLLGQEAFALFEDQLATPGSALLLHEHLHNIDCLSADQAGSFFSHIEAQQRQGHWIALIAHYELASAFEAHAPQAHAATRLARAMVFRQATRLQGEALDAWWAQQLAGLSAQARDAGVLTLHTAPHAADRYLQQVQRVLDYIRAGDCYQVNLSLPLHGQSFGHPAALYARLRSAQPVRHGGLLFDGDRWLLSHSPELFFTRQDSRIDCRPMKGTAARTGSAEADAQIAATLQASEKNRAENLMIVDLIRNDLGRLAPAGQVRVERLFELEPYPSVFQLTSSICAEGVEASLAELFQALFPCGSITGAPKLRAMQIIDELEARPRHVYCGAIGHIAPDGDCHFNVPIRTLRVERDGQCHLDVGSGIVADSVPEEELAECLAKARFVREDGLQLIETLRCEAGQPSPWPLLAYHLQRLRDSAQALHFAYREADILSALSQHTQTLTAGTHRLRLLLSRDGRVSLSSAPLEALHTQPRIRLAAQSLDAADPRLQHKTSARSFYDTALQAAIAEGFFDEMFCNTRGELCEGARSNLFIERAGQLLTPARHCGLLPGVMRASLLAEHGAREAVLYPQDLEQADRIFVSNALRGLVEVSLQRA